MKRKTSFSIALSAVSCAIATIFMALGIHVPYMYLPGYVFGALAILLPLSEDFFGGACLAWIAASLICLPIGGIAVFYKLFPFIAFFGPHPIVNALLRRKGKNGWLARIVKAVWFDGMLCAAWAIFAAMTEVSLPFSWMYDWIYPMIVAAGTAVFFIYDCKGKGQMETVSSGCPFLIAFLHPTSVGRYIFVKFLLTPESGVSNTSAAY